MGKLFLSSLKMLYRDKQTVFWALAFPVIFAVVFALFDFDDAPELRFKVVSQSTSPLSEALVDGLEKVDSFTVSETTDLARARSDVTEGETDLGIVVPAVAEQSRGSASSARLEVFYNGDNVQEARVGLDAVGRIVQEMNLKMAGVHVPPVAIDDRPVSGKTVNYYDFLLPGLVAMGVMQFAIIGMAVAVARYREQRVLKRILATPLRPAKFLSAQVGARLVLSLVQAALILAVGVFVFGANIYGNVLWLLVLALIANLIFLNFGFAVGGRTANADAAQGLGNAIALPMLFLSGVFFPLDTLPNVLQSIVRFLPLTPLIEAMRKVAIDGESLTAAGPQLVMLAAWVVVSFFIATRFFRLAEN